MAKDKQKREIPWLSMKVLVVVVTFVGVALIMFLCFTRSYSNVYRKDYYVDIVSSSLPDGVDAPIELLEMDVETFVHDGKAFPVSQKVESESSDSFYLLTLLMESQTILKVENVPLFNLAFLWNETHRTWSAIGRWYQNPHQCSETMHSPHRINTIAYSNNASALDSFIAIDVPLSVRSTNIGEPKWVTVNGESGFILAYTNGPPKDANQFAFDETKASFKSRYKNYIYNPKSKETTLIQYDTPIEENNPTAKNFLFFSHENSTYVITLIHPSHDVYEWNQNGMIEKKFSTVFRRIWKERRYSLSTGPVLIPGTGWLAGGHTAEGGWKGYRMSYFYVFRDSPPFDIICMTPEISFGHSTREEYIMNIELIDNDLYISIGVSVCSSVLLKVPLDNILSQCH